MQWEYFHSDTDQEKEQITKKSQLYICQVLNVDKGLS